MYGFWLRSENSFRKVKSSHLLDKKHTNLSQFSWLNDSVVPEWLVWRVAVRDMFSLFCGGILLSEIFSNVFIAKSKNEFPTDLWRSTIFGCEKLSSPKWSPISPPVCSSEVLTHLLPPVRGTLESWEFMSVQFCWQTGVLFDTLYLFTCFFSCLELSCFLFCTAQTLSILCFDFPILLDSLTSFSCF